MANETKKQREAREAREAAAAAQESTATQDPQEETQEDPLAGLSDENSQPFVDDLLGQAAALEEEKQGIYNKIAANRETLRTIAKTGLLSEKQAAAIVLWYPVRQKRANGDAAGE